MVQVQVIGRIFHSVGEDCQRLFNFTGNLKEKRMENDLTLAEQLLVLAVRPGKGGLLTFPSGTINYCLLGSGAFELIMAGNVVLHDRKLEVISGKTTIGLHTFLLEKMEKSIRPRSVSHWLSRWGFSGRKMRSLVYQSLAAKGEIKLEERRFLFFKWKIPVLMPKNHVYNLINSIKSMVIRGPGVPEEIYLLSLLEPAGLLRRIYPDRRLRKPARLKIKGFLNPGIASGALTEAVENAGLVRSAVLSAIRASRASSV